MARRSKNAKTHETGKAEVGFARIFRDMYQGKAWEELTPQEKIIYLDMKFEYNKEMKSDEFIFPLRQKADKLKIAEKTIIKAIDSLIQRGFIRVIKRGLPRGGAKNNPTIYGFNSSWKYYGTKDFYIKQEYYRTLKQENEAKNKRDNITKPKINDRAK